MHALISTVTTNKTEFTTSKQEGIKIGDERTQSIQKRKDNQKQRRRDGNRR